MAVASDPVLLDNCAISACVRAGAWKALASRYQLETVETVESEATTGYQHRTIIDPREFREQVRVHRVELEARLDCESEYAELAALDDGERDLWIHALNRKDGWILCGPDIASIRFGVMRGYEDRLVALEDLLEAIGFKPKPALQESQTRKWLQSQISKFSLEKKFKELKG